MGSNNLRRGYVNPICVFASPWKMKLSRCETDKLLKFLGEMTSRDNHNTPQLFYHHILFLPNPKLLFYPQSKLQI